MKLMTKTMLKAWAAGFFDGEGYVGIHKNGHGRGRYLEVKVSNTDRVPLDLLRDHWGGSISSHRSSAVGAKPAFQWTISSQAASVFLADIQPWLVMAKNQQRVALALEFQAGKPLPGHRLAEGRIELELRFHEQISVLNARGIPAFAQGRL